MSGLVAPVVAVYSVATHAGRTCPLAGLTLALVAGAALIANDLADLPFDVFVIGAR